MISQVTFDRAPVRRQEPVFARGMLRTRPRSDKLRATLILLSCVVLLNACTGGQTNNSNETPVVSVPPNTTYPMPPLSGKSIGKMGWKLADGRRGLFSDYKGKVLVLDFYATWCLPCRDSVPQLVELQRRFENRGLQVIGLNVGGPDDLDKVPDFAREFRIQYVLATPDDDLSNFLLSDNSYIPQTFIFDRQGQLKKRFIGFGGTTGKQIDEVVESALESSAN